MHACLPGRALACPSPILWLSVLRHIDTPHGLQLRPGTIVTKQLKVIEAPDIVVIVSAIGMIAPYRRCPAEPAWPSINCWPRQYLPILGLKLGQRAYQANTLPARPPDIVAACFFSVPYKSKHTFHCIWISSEQSIVRNHWCVLYLHSPRNVSRRSANQYILWSHIPRLDQNTQHILWHMSHTIITTFLHRLSTVPMLRTCRSRCDEWIVVVRNNATKHNDVVRWTAQLASPHLAALYFNLYTVRCRYYFYWWQTQTA